MPEPDAPWWRRTTVYQIYPRSFADSNADGVGDLRGIVGKLDYLKHLGVETLWVSPFFASPQADFGYDISDHYGIAPEYGTEADCLALIAEVHARGMKLVFDMVLNHTSIEHPWFTASRASRASPKRDWYIWREGRGRRGARPPNNWRSMLGPSGWHRDEATGDWYWASFLPFQPDLNYRNPDVKRAMLDVVRHWLAAGVDGLRLDIFNAIFKDAGFEDNPLSTRAFPTEDDPHGFFQRHTGTIDHPDTLAFARELRGVVDQFSDPPRFLVGEVFGDADMLKRYCGEADDAGLHLVFLFKTMRTECNARSVRAPIAELEHAFPDPFVPTYVFGNHDRPRFGGRHDDHLGKAKLFATLQLTARGVPFIYYGEEIGMGHHEIPIAIGLDPVASRYGFMPQWGARALRRFGILLNRDEARRPMQWHAGRHGGFSESEFAPWLPMHPHYETVNVAVQEHDPGSLLSCYRRLLALRKTRPALGLGTLELLDGQPRDVVAYRRTHGDDVATVYLNFADAKRRIRADASVSATMFSSHHGDLGPAPPSIELAAHESIIVLSASAPV